MKDEYQGYFADCYVLTDKRIEVFIEEFLNYFVPKRRFIDEFFDNSVEIFKTHKEAIKFLVENKSEEQSLYWSNPIKSELRGAELFFTNDSHVILGIYCETKYPNTEIEDKILKEIMEFCGSNLGYITYGDKPPLNSEEFIEIMKK